MPRNAKNPPKPRARRSSKKKKEDEDWLTCTDCHLQDTSVEQRADGKPRCPGCQDAHEDLERARATTTPAAGDSYAADTAGLDDEPLSLSPEAAAPKAKKGAKKAAKPKQVNLEGELVARPGLVRHDVVPREDHRFEGDYYRVGFTSGQLQKFRGAESDEQRLVTLEKKMKLRKEVEELPPDGARDVDRAAFLAEIMHGRHDDAAENTEAAAAEE